MSKRLVVAVSVLTLVAVIVAFVLKSPLGALWAVVTSAATLWSVELARRTVDRVAEAMRGGKAPRLMMFLAILAKFPLIGLIAFGAAKSGPVALTIFLILVVSVYSLFVWDAVAKQRPA